jgi:hypothetical protein
MQQAATARVRKLAAISGVAPDSPERGAERPRLEFSAGQPPGGGAQCRSKSGRLFEFHHISTENKLLICTNIFHNWHHFSSDRLILSFRHHAPAPQQSA